MDMLPAFVDGVCEVLPNAHMTFDRFYIMKLANEALDSVRKEEAQESRHFNGRRFLWLCHPRSLSAPARVKALGSVHVLRYRSVEGGGISQTVVSLGLLAQNRANEGVCSDDQAALGWHPPPSSL
jgi:hypothetical protein